MVSRKNTASVRAKPIKAMKFVNLNPNLTMEFEDIVGGKMKKKGPKYLVA